VLDCCARDFCPRRRNGAAPRGRRMEDVVADIILCTVVCCARPRPRVFFRHDASHEAATSDDRGGAARRKRHPFAVAVADGLVPRVLFVYSWKCDRSFVVWWYVRLKEIGAHTSPLAHTRW